MRIRCDEIIIKDRYRKDLGNLDELTESIQSYGLLQPIGINNEKELVFGYRRLRACEKLGNEEIEANIVDVPSIIEGEYVKMSSGRISMSRSVLQSVKLWKKE